LGYGYIDDFKIKNFEHSTAIKYDEVFDFIESDENLSVSDIIDFVDLCEEPYINVKDDIKCFLSNLSFNKWFLLVEKITTDYKPPIYLPSIII